MISSDSSDSNDTPEKNTLKMKKKKGLILLYSSHGSVILTANIIKYFR